MYSMTFNNTILFTFRKCFFFLRYKHYTSEVEIKKKLNN